MPLIGPSESRLHHKHLGCKTLDMDSVEELRTLAIRQRLDGLVRADLLIDAAVRAVVQGVDSPSLSILAGLTRTEEGEAQELFRAAANELNIAPPEQDAGRWQLVRWLCRQIVEGRLPPAEGGQLIWREGLDRTRLPRPPATLGRLGERVAGLERRLGRRSRRVRTTDRL